MNLSENVNILSNAANEIAARLSTCLANLRGPVPTNPNENKPAQSGGLAGDLERIASKLFEAAQMLGELEAMTARKESMNHTVVNTPFIGKPY